MRFEPGPLPQLDESEPASTSVEGGFGDLARSEMVLPGIYDSDITTGLDTLTAYASTTPSNELAAFINPALGAATDLSDIDNPARFLTVDNDIYSGDGYLLQSYGSTPGEAWLPLPAALTEPGVPNLPPQPGTTTITIGKPGNPLDQQFVVGGPYQVNVLIQQIPTGNAEIANLLVIMNVFLRFGDPQERQLGRTDVTGRLTFNGSWQSTDVGEWYINFIVVGTTISINAGNAHFFVAPSSGGGTPTTPAVPITVTIMNLRTGSATVFRVGDSWLVTVRGGPNLDVGFAGYRNGVFQFSGIYNRTDASGRVDATGTFQPADVGNWVETYNVGGVQWNGQLAFSITN